MKKLVFRNFRYMYCDDFSAFLRKMSKKGWHFSRWGAALEFEKGEPRDTEYRVEVFDRAEEMDYKAGADTLEYGEYCQAAGWTLADSKHKFCIFRKDSPSAPAIVTEEERFDKIRGAELGRWLRSLLTGGLPAVLFVWMYWYFTFTTAFYDNLLLAVPGLLLLLVFMELADGIHIFFWFRQKSAELRAGEIPFYGTKNDFCCFLIQKGTLLLYFFILLVMLYISFARLEPRAFGVSLFSLVLLWFIRYLMNHFRPGKELRVPAAAAAVILYVLLSTGVEYYFQPEQPGSSAASYVEESESIFGKKTSYTLKKQAEGTEPDSSVLQEFASAGLPVSGDMDIYMDIYESPCSSVLEKSWDALTKRFYEYNNALDTSSEWHAQKAISNTLSNIHILFYPGRVIYLSADRGFPKEERRVIQQKLYEKYGKQR